MANDAINTTRNQRVPRLNGYQPTKSMAKHKDWPNPSHATDGEENDANPPNGISIERPKPNSVRVGRQKARK